MGRDSISSQEIGEYTNVNATQIRRDLSGFGKFGKRGVGYNIDYLIVEIRKILRTSGQHNIALIGAGSLGQRVAKSTGVRRPRVQHHRGVRHRPRQDRRGHRRHARSGADLNDTVRDRNIIVGVLAVPEAAAQAAANALVDADVKIIFNYSDSLIDTPST